jgi:colicin import membrane protein
MLGLVKRNPRAAALAVVLHITLLLFLLFGLDWMKLNKPAAPPAAMIQATVIDAEQMNQAKQAEEEAKAAREAAKRAEEKRLAEQQRKRAEEKQRLAQLEKQRLAAAEVKRQAEAEAKRKAEAEAKRKAEAEAKRKAEAAAAAQAARERALQAQLEAEQNGREIDRYAAVIKQQVTRSWLRPPNVGEGLSCIVQVRLIPGGEVVPGGVSIIKSSGNAAFDRSVETAVYKATPLPVPSGNLFESFRNFKLYFNPQ